MVKPNRVLTQELNEVTHLTVGPLLKAARIVQDVSRADLAEEAGVSESWLAELEAGHSEPSLTKVARVSAALGISFASFADKWVRANRANARMDRVIAENPEAFK